MHQKMSLTAESVENHKLLALFNTLEEEDKDIVISMSEFLMEKYRSSIDKNNNSDGKSDYIIVKPN